MVREAFGVDGEAVLLDGGEGVTVRVGGAVLKQVRDVDEAEWTQELQSQPRPDTGRSSSRTIA